MFVYGCVMKEQSKPSKVNTVLLVIILVINLTLGLFIFNAQQAQSEKIEKIYFNFSTLEADSQYNKEQINNLVSYIEELQKVLNRLAQ